MENNEGIGKMGLQEGQREKEYSKEKKREKDVPQSSQALLGLEGNYPVCSKGSVLQICKSNDILQFKMATANPPNTKPVISSVPRSQFLGKVKDFLGVMSESNKRLLETVDKSEDYNIEALSGNESEYIEMDLMLGIADLHTPEAVAAAESAIAGNQPLVPVADTSSEEESEDSSDADDCGSTDNDETEKDSRSPTEHRRKPVEDESSNEALKKSRMRKRQKIVEL